MDVGFAAGPEAELYRRALAGPSDPGSMRALEMVLKSRSPAYQEKHPFEKDSIAEAGRAITALATGWQGGSASDRV